MLSMWASCTGNLGWGSSVKSKKSTGRLLGPWKCAHPFRALEEADKHSQIAFTYSLLPVSDWVDGLIDPSGLLLVVSHLLTVPVLLAGGVGKQSVTKTWMWEIIFVGSHTERWWRYSYKSKLSSTPFKGCTLSKVIYVQAIIFAHLWRCLSTLQTIDYCTGVYMNQLIGQQTMILYSQDRWRWCHWLGRGSSQCVPIMFPLSSLWVPFEFP